MQTFAQAGFCSQSISFSTSQIDFDDLFMIINMCCLFINEIDCLIKNPYCFKEITSKNEFY